MLTCSRQWLPKIAYVFDEDVDIFDPDRVMWAFAWRFDPGRDTLILPGQNVLPLEPMCNANKPPVNLSKIGFDCTIPLVGGFDVLSFAACKVTPPLGGAPSGIAGMSEDDIATSMESFIKEAPRSWLEILTRFSGQPYPLVYRAFGRLRHRLGRMADDRPTYPYTLSDSCFVEGKK